MRCKTPDESIGNAAQEHRLEQAGVVEKNDEANVRPRILRSRTNPGEVGTIKNLAQKFEQEQHAEDGCAAEEGHGFGETIKSEISNFEFRISNEKFKTGMCASFHFQFEI